LGAKGYGETRLKNDCGNGMNCSEAQHQENRRTEIKVLEF
jgi:flagellar motor protein MotB